LAVWWLLARKVRRLKETEAAVRIAAEPHDPPFE
jgi:hypothetical protein